jgi:hypothetical protein
MSIELPADVVTWEPASRADSQRLDYQSGDIGAATTFASAVATSSKGRGKGRSGATVVAKRISSDQVVEDWKGRAKQFVHDFKEAISADNRAVAEGRPALARLALIPRLSIMCSRVHIHETLVELDILSILGNCIADVARKQLAPYDLRCAAYAALEQFAVEGVNCGRLIPRKKRAREGGASDSIEDEVTYHGITMEQVKACPDLGRAINMARRSSEETTENRRRAAALLENFSRCFHGVDDTTGGSGGGSGPRGGAVRWKSRGDSTVLPPFEVLKGDAERYLTKFARVDELDPSSYSRVPEPRAPPAYITALFLGKQSSRNDDDE